MTEHPNLAAALVAALSELTVIGKDRTANAGAYSYDYAALEDVVKITRPALAEHGIIALSPIHDHGNGLACTVKLVHTSGETMDLGPFPFPHGRDAQATGSMVTYHRRYSLLAALGMAAGDDDDDGATAAARQPERDEVACSRCGDVVPGARSDKEPMRAHLVAVHDWVRQSDGTVIAPEKHDERPFDEPAGVAS